VAFHVVLGAALLLGLFLHGPSLGGGFRGDDYVQYAMFRAAFPAPRSNLDLFSFAAGTPDDHQRLVAFGHLPWWTHPELRLRMWRPLASALMALDFAVFDRRAELQHAHSLLWFGLLLWAAGRVLWRCLPETAAALALLLFASAPCHTLPVGWLANRSSLIGSALAFFTLDFLLAARDATHVRRQRLVTALLASLTLAAGEYGLAALAYALVWSAAQADSWRTRLYAMLPVLVPMLGYLAAHHLVGSGMVHSGYYISPWHAPRDFVLAVLTRVPVLVADLLLGLPSAHYTGASPWRYWLLSSGLVPMDVWLKLPSWQSCHVALGYAAVALGYALWRSQRRREAAERAPGWLLLGAAFSLLPCAGSLPEDRLLIGASLGVSAGLACVLVALSRSLIRPDAPRRRLKHIALCCAPCWVMLTGLQRSHADVRNMRLGSDSARAYGLDADLPTDAAASTRVYVVSTGDFNTAVNLPWLRLTERGQTPPQAYRRLSPSALPLVLTRTAERVIELNVVTNAVYGTAVPSLYRDAGAAVRAGERHRLPGLDVAVLEVAADNPTRMRFEFDRSVDDQSLWFLFATDHGLRRQHLPPIGESVTVPFAQFADVRAKAARTR